jgi:glutamate N-acetyltransferase/amino-acid N-acetyltransferase
MNLLSKIEGGGITSPPGFQAAGVKCGLKNNSYDLALLFSENQACAAGVFTRNKFRAAPVILTEARIKNQVRAVVINSGNANACTGQKGLADAEEMASAAASSLQIAPDSVLVASTGVIGSYLPLENVKQGIKKASLLLSSAGGKEAALAIMTTDTVPKETAYQNLSGEKPFVIGGMAKGSGMICPDMATMLAFLTTDVHMERELLQEALSRAVERTFNMITVDGDTSTNDMVLLLANGARGGGKIKSRESDDFKLFSETITRCCRDLAVQIMTDGEGATKLLHLNVKGAVDFSSGKKIARSVLNSLLVKTAFFGEDANWGRIVAAMGYAGVDFIPEKVDVFLGNLQVASKGRGLPFDEENAKKVLRKREITVTIDLNMGPEELEAWGCDLSYEYVRLNGSYRS